MGGRAEQRHRRKADEKTERRAEQAALWGTFDVHEILLRLTRIGRKRFNYEGHEETQRKTLVILCAPLWFKNS